MTAVDVARELVAEQFPGARAAWLGGSVARGSWTSTSDLDITVLIAGPPAPYRESLRYGGWPVELFVHTEASLAHYRGEDQDRRQPTMMRLVGEAIVLLDTDGSGARL
jgi:predicted nucleotidyltransferase